MMYMRNRIEHALFEIAVWAPVKGLRKSKSLEGLKGLSYRLVCPSPGCSSVLTKHDSFYYWVDQP